MTELSDAGTRTQVARVKAEYPNQLDYIGMAGPFPCNLLARCRIEAGLGILYHLEWQVLGAANDRSGVRTHALTDWRLKPAP